MKKCQFRSMIKCGVISVLLRKNTSESQNFLDKEVTFTSFFAWRPVLAHNMGSFDLTCSMLKKH